MLVNKPGGISADMKEPVQRLYHTPVPLVVKALLTILVPKENIAPRLVIEKGVAQMENKKFDSLLGYKTAVAQAKEMLSKGLITPKEYSVIETKMCEKFGINSCSLYRENDWLYTLFRGNMSSIKEVI